MNIIEEVLSACVSSARSEPMVLKQGKHEYRMHTQLHVMMTMPSGSFKSTILKSLPKKAIVEAQDYSYPAMIGSVSKHGVVKGYIMKAAGKCLPIDEFHSLGYKPRKALLSITEDQRATRVFGFNSNIQEKKSSKYLKYRIIDNELHIDYIRCSILLAGIFAPHKKRKACIDDFAFSSRFLPINLQATFDEIDDIGLGKKKVFNVNYEPYTEAPVFESWEKFLRTYRVSVSNMPTKIRLFFSQNPEFYTRGRMLISRLFSWASRGNSVVDDWEKYIPYIPFFLYSTVASTLTYSEFEVYDRVCKDMKQHEIASELGVSEAHVSMTVKKLKGCGLC